jgi:hypothetical protein
MVIEDKIVRVDKRKAMARLQPMLNGYLSQWNEVYIGATADYERRAEQHGPDGWMKMVLLYEALNADIARELERDLIHYARHCNFRVDVTNDSDGGEGLRDHNRHHHVYLLVR